MIQLIFSMLKIIHQSNLAINAQINDEISLKLKKRLLYNSKYL
jgi:putative salt-induced outer membrane protein YdiY